jgi:hypothetical protein
MDLALKQQDRAHRRHLTAIAALATVRKLLPAGEAGDRADGDRVLVGRAVGDGKEPEGPLVLVAFPRPGEPPGERDAAAST